MEAELDYFGSHNYDKKSEGDGEVKKGAWIGGVRETEAERLGTRKASLRVEKGVSGEG
ncbi:hypothetical protein TRAPUB_7715 [Trametes pubescens]|uniref:Uncharacterized protein n=1 Tax=Trametes pubescens TaxID=154538 RepID=A0A1M2V2K0_TRAPU|nr:hypothetical protein TRAPUB_7715 [Trametes pubescens]